MELSILKQPRNINMIINYMAVMYAFLLPISRAGISLFSLLFVLLWLYEGNLKQKWIAIKNNKVLFSFLLFILFSALSIVWTENMVDAKRPLRMLTYFFTLYVIATSIKKEYIHHIITAFLFGMLISEIVSYGVYFEWWQFKNATPQNPSPFMYHIDYSVFLAFTSIILLNRIFSKYYTKKEKIMLFIFFLTVTGNLFIGVGRTGQVAFIAGVIVMSLIHFKVSYKAAVSSVLLISIIFVLAYNVSDNFNRRANQALGDINKIQNMDFRSSWGIRAAYWQTTYEVVKDNPLIGVGIGDYMDETKSEVMQKKYDPKKYNKKFMSTNTPHNQFLLIVLQLGLIGLFLFLYFIYAFIYLPIKNPEWKELSILFITIFTVSCIADTFFMQQFTIALFAFFIGLFVSTSIDDINQQDIVIEL
jgi:O-antigen ligase